MKTILTSFAFILFFIHSVFSQSPIHGEIILHVGDVNSFAAFNNDTVLATNKDLISKMMERSVDGGHTWHPVVADTIINQFVEIACIGANTALAIQAGGIYKTTDAGVTWMPMGRPYNLTYTRILFLDSLTGYILSSFGRYLKTTDGGNNWSLHALSQNAPLTDMQWLNSQNGYIMCFGAFFYTHDGGSNWNYIPQAVGYRILMHDSLFGFAFTGNNIRYTMDGGYSWRDTMTNMQMEYISKVNEQIIFGTANDTIWKTSDGGLTWQFIFITPTTSNRIDAIYFKDEFHGWYCQDYKIYYTTDGGITWTPSSSNILLGIGIVNGYQKDSLIFFYGRNVGLPRGSIKSYDNGSSWVQNISAPGYTGMYDIDFIDAASGYFIMNDTVFYFTDTLATISKRGAISSGASIIGFDSMNVAVQSGGKATLSHDGGLTFTPFSSCCGNYFKQKVNDSTAFFITNSNKLFRTTNYGLTLDSLYTFNFVPNGLDFADNTYGLVYEFNNLKITNNGGASFFDAPNPPHNITQAFRLNASDILLRISGGDIYLSQDGGYNFNHIIPGWSNCLVSILKLDGHIYWISYSFTLRDPVFDVIHTTDIAETKINLISVYPNPTQQYINVQNNFDTNDFNSFEIFDMYGRIVQFGRITNHSGEIKIQLNGLVSGYYILNLISKSGERYNARICINN